ncbi:hypothetical protein RO3G_03497 [Rhizopus delemar RA 99-880]|uniref:Ricin B lectin domain-containing protein n=1 Tax=Rhizopus delemar (strain RA 99-880 / ATCC MYA-4621 / FGSC 9543 / NRRL 43880) TaxID=246409 RepID=I1BRG2_RHIO9|nr:hypothetical protein RO3G_03497 [Rhizopus delemar RA 99-880]|eukprot:EIE78792.1 hypothetical protein RO3G_03497 [Rhizopus delemar RA 99-880]
MFLKKGYFHVVQAKTGLFLSTNGTTEEGTKITVKDKVWGFENGQLISKNSSLVLDIEGGDLRVGKKLIQYGRKKTMAHNQRWGIRNGYIYASADPRLVLEDNSEASGSQIVTSVRKVEENDFQQWKIVPYKEAVKEEQEEEEEEKQKEEQEEEQEEE